MTVLDAPRARKTHIWTRETLEHYVEPFWCSERLFAVEPFVQEIWDPACGFGRIVESARAAHYPAIGTDIVDRGFRHLARVEDFLTSEHQRPNIVTNPPFDIFKEFALKALQATTGKVAMLWLVPRLNAARWLQDTPLARILLLTPRPSMPPGHTITAGQKPGGGTQDFCWLIWDHAHAGPAQIGWLHRDAGKAL